MHSSPDRPPVDIQTGLRALPRFNSSAVSRTRHQASVPPLTDTVTNSVTAADGIKQASTHVARVYREKYRQIEVVRAPRRRRRRLLFLRMICRPSQVIDVKGKFKTFTPTRLSTCRLEPCEDGVSAWSCSDDTVGDAENRDRQLTAVVGTRRRIRARLV